MTLEQDTRFLSYRSRQIWVFFLFLILFAVSTKRSVSSWNDASRMATIQALAEQGTLAIDKTIFVDLTSDIYIYQDHTYSSKPPALAVMGVLIYAPLHLVGVSFEEDPSLSYFLVTLLTIGSISALGLVYFWKMLVEFFDASVAWANVSTFLAGAGTLILPYSTVFNSHAVTGSFLLIGSYYAFRFLKDVEIHHVFYSGLLFSIAASIDTSCFIFLPFAFLIILRKSFKSALVFTAACAPLILFYFGMNLYLSDSLLPPTLNAPLRSSIDSPFTTDNLSGLASHENLSDLFTYAFHMLLGNRGLLSHTPLLVFSLIGTYSLYRKRASQRFYADYLLLLAGCSIYILLTIFRTNNYSGDAFGVRWYVSITLILSLALAFIEGSVRTNRKYLMAFWVVSASSILLALVGSYRPFLPTSKPVIGEPQIVDNTILVALERLVTLSTTMGKIRLLLLAALLFCIFVLLVRQFHVTQGESRANQSKLNS
ncbi:MAG: hypothetical protein E4G99_03675 [Anaerolineales bacterium]|nr:MAG: hypothetical protein E4G99_03675 [Anaerolineales bacterium]